MNNIVETVEKYGEIICLQKQVIDELFLLLLQHVTAEELDNLPCVEKINAAAIIKDEIETMEERNG